MVAQNCQALLNHGLYNVETRTSQDDFSQNLFNQLCSDTFRLDSLSESEVKSFGGSLSYAGFGVGGNSDEGSTRQELSIARNQFCSTMSSQTTSNQQASSEVRTLFPQALATFERCLELEAQGLEIDVEILPSPEATRIVTFGLTSTVSGTSGGLILSAVNITPEEAFTCTGRKEPGAPVIEFDKNIEAILSSSQVSFECTRNQKNGVYEDAYISLLTNYRSSNLAMHFPRVPLLPELQEERAIQLEAQIEELENRTRNFIQPSDMACPSGYAKATIGLFIDRGLSPVREAVDNGGFWEGFLIEPDIRRVLVPLESDARESWLYAALCVKED